MAHEELTSLCCAHTSLTAADREILCHIEEMMPLFSRLIDADLFLDCFSADGAKCMVVAEARGGKMSLYSKSVVGQGVIRENEPAVFSAMATGMPVRDVLAVTQECRTVRQVALPVKNNRDLVIGVLVQEKDITDSVAKDKKYTSLVKIAEDQQRRLHLIDPTNTGVCARPSAEDRLALQETHHRVKNNLQLVASILNLQARASELPEVQKIFRETVSRIRSIAAIYDLLSANETAQAVPLLSLLSKVCHNVAACSGCEKRGIEIAITGEDFSITSGQASTVALVANELVMNAVEHAFADDGGKVTVTALPGREYASITVRDDGSGFDIANTRPGGLGLSFVQSLVEEKLGSILRMESGPDGSRFSFDFQGTYIR